jgi:hypothetical protein
MVGAGDVVKQLTRSVLTVVISPAVAERLKSTQEAETE